MSTIQQVSLNNSLINKSTLSSQSNSSIDRSKDTKLYLLQELYNHPYAALQNSSQQNSTATVLNVISQIVVNFTALLEKAFQLIDQAMKIANENNAATSTPVDQTTETSNEETTPATTNETTTEKKPTSLESSGEFLWKPISEKDKKLAILLPSNVSRNATAVRILDSKGKLIEKGTYSGVGNGNRAHFRFKKTGSFYPDKAIVEIVMKNGSVKRVRIPETSQRFVK